jgi:hypothetical protein
VLGAQLRLFQFQFAGPGVNLLEQRGGEVAILGLQPGIGSDHQLRVALRSGAVLGLAQNAIRGRGHQLAAQLVDLQQQGVVLRLARIAVRRHLRRAEKAVLILKSRQSAADRLPPGPSIPSPDCKPFGLLRGGLDTGLGVLLAVNPDEIVDHSCRQSRIAAAETEFEPPWSEAWLPREAAFETDPADRPAHLGDGGACESARNSGNSFVKRPLKPGAW